MEQRIIFRQLLAELKEMAELNGGAISTDEIDAHLSHARLTKEQLSLVYEHLRGEKINVTAKEEESARPGVTDKDADERADKRADKRSSVLEVYLKDIDKISSIPAREELELFRLSAGGDKNARDALAAAYLGVVCDLAAQMENEHLPVEDLIQEGNIGLLTALTELEEQASLAAYKTVLVNRVAVAMQEALREHSDRKEMDDGMVKKVTHLEQAIRNLKEDLGREPSIDEVSAYLDMSVAQLMNILKLAGDELFEP